MHYNNRQKLNHQEFLVIYTLVKGNTEIIIKFYINIGLPLITRVSLHLAGVEIFKYPTGEV